MTAAPARIAKLRRPASFAASLRAPSVQVAEFRLHLRPVLDVDAIDADACCAVGFMLPKRLCKSSVRRNLIRRVLRTHVQDWVRQAPVPQGAATVLVFRLMQKLPAEFVSARSSTLATALHTRADQLFDRLQQRLRRPA